MSSLQGVDKQIATSLTRVQNNNHGSATLAARVRLVNARLVLIFDLP